MRRALALGLLAFVLASVAALSEPFDPGKEGELAKLVPPRDGERACFSRAYDAKHLQAHPDQKVARIDFTLSYYIHEPDEYWPQGQRNYYFRLQAELRDRKASRPLSAAGECSPSADGKGIWCGVECDGGGVVIERRDGGKLLVDLEATGRIRMTEGCDGEEEDSVDLVPGKDDKTFLLAPLAAAQCPVYEDW